MHAQCTGEDKIEQLAAGRVLYNMEKTQNTLTHNLSIALLFKAQYLVFELQFFKWYMQHKDDCIP